MFLERRHSRANSKYEYDQQETKITYQSTSHRDWHKKYETKNMYDYQAIHPLPQQKNLKNTQIPSKYQIPCSYRTISCYNQNTNVGTVDGPLLNFQNSQQTKQILKNKDLNFTIEQNQYNSNNYQNQNQNQQNNQKQNQIQKLKLRKPIGLDLYQLRNRINQ